MNIFYVDYDPERAAQALCDKHVVKMILESAQMLSTAHHVCNHGINCDDLYKMTHVNHPSSIWVRQDLLHYSWLWNHAMALCKEYTERYGRVHKTQSMIENRLVYDPLDIPTLKFDEPPQCMPDKYKDNDTVIAYRNYYMGDKASIATWKRNKPDWFII